MALILLSRTALNIAFRIVYPYLPAISRELDIPLSFATQLITLRMLGVMAAPFLGPLSDRYGRRRVMSLAMVVFTGASLLLATSSTVLAAALAFLMYGLAKALYDPAVLAYLGDTIPYARRGRAIGIAELSWSAAWLLGVPVTGLLLENYGFRAPWIVLAGLGILAAILTQTALRPRRRAQERKTGHEPRTQPRLAEGGERRRALVKEWLALLQQPNIRRLLLIGASLSMAVETPFVVYGAWLEESFGLSLSALGVASVAIGLAEGVAEIGTSLVTDRLGKQRSVLFGLIGLASSLAVLPLLAARGLVPGLAGVVLMILTFEFGIVSYLSLVTEIAPQARGILLSMNFAVISLSRILADFIGAWVWRWESIGVQAGVGVLFALVGVALATRGALVRDALT
jgi:predicted MFS family arabinose efflux permease